MPARHLRHSATQGKLLTTARHLPGTFFVRPPPKNAAHAYASGLCLDRGAKHCRLYRALHVFLNTVTPSVFLEHPLVKVLRGSHLRLPQALTRRAI